MGKGVQAPFLSILLSILLHVAGYSQGVFPERSGVPFDAVLELDSLNTSEQIWSGATAYAYKLPYVKRADPPKVELIETDKLLKSNGSFYIKTDQLGKHPAGAAYFTVHIQVKENKYRYYYHDIEFIPYERNRYSLYEPVNSKKVSYEKLVNGGKKSRSIATKIAERLQQQVGNLESYVRITDSGEKANKQKESEIVNW